MKEQYNKSLDQIKIQTQYQYNYMNKKINKYLPGNLILKETEQLGSLVLGDCNSAIDFTVLKPNKIKTIISIGIEALPPKQKISEQINHKFYDIHDNKQQKLSVQLLDQIVSLIEENRKKGGVLVHCYAGVSRSSSFVIAYVMSKYNLGYDQAKEKVKKHRPCIHPGDGFVRHLQQYGKVLEKRQEDRLKAIKEKQVIEVKVEIPPKIEITPIQSVVVSERVKRGVRGAVKCADGISPQKYKSSVMETSVISNTKIEEKQETSNSIILKQQSQKVQKLPPIHRQKVDLPTMEPSRYSHSSSHIEIKRNIEKIEGKTMTTQNSSIRGIYGNKTKVK